MERFLVGIERIVSADADIIKIAAAYFFAFACDNAQRTALVMGFAFGEVGDAARFGGEIDAVQRFRLHDGDFVIAAAVAQRDRFAGGKNVGDGIVFDFAGPSLILLIAVANPSPIAVLSSSIPHSTVFIKFNNTA